MANQHKCTGNGDIVVASLSGMILRCAGDQPKSSPGF